MSDAARRQRAVDRGPVAVDDSVGARGRPRDARPPPAVSESLVHGARAAHGAAEILAAEIRRAAARAPRSPAADARSRCSTDAASFEGIILMLRAVCHLTLLWQPYLRPAANMPAATRGCVAIAWALLSLAFHSAWCADDPCGQPNLLLRDELLVPHSR